MWVITTLKLDEVPFQIPVLDACIGADPLMAVPATLATVTISVSVTVSVIVWSPGVAAAELGAKEDVAVGCEPDKVAVMEMSVEGAAAFRTDPRTIVLVMVVVIVLIEFVYPFHL